MISHRVNASVITFLLLSTSSIAQTLDNQNFRGSISSPIFFSVNGESPGDPDSSPIAINVTPPPATREMASNSTTVEISGFEVGDSIHLSGPSGVSWIPGTQPNEGTISWAGLSAGTHTITLSVRDEDDNLRLTQSANITIVEHLSASIPESEYTVAIGETLTISPDITGLISPGSVQWGAEPSLPEWLSLDSNSGSISVDTSSPNTFGGIVLTAVDQTDSQTSDTNPFSVSVLSGMCNLTWSDHTIPGNSSWRSLAYGNGVYIAVAASAASGTTRMLRSTNGETWSIVSAANSRYLTGVAYGNGRFVAVAMGGDRLMTSTDGLTWTSPTSTVAQAGNWNDITFGDGKFVAVSQGNTHRIMTSTDGLTWTAHTEPSSQSWHAITYGNGSFVGTSETDSFPSLLIHNGLAWQTRNPTSNRILFDVAYSPELNKFVAVGSTGSVVLGGNPGTDLFYSYAANSNPDHLQGASSVSYGDGRFIAVKQRAAFESIDGITWTPIPRPAGLNSFTNINWSTVEYLNGKFFIMTTGNTVRIGECS